MAFVGRQVQCQLWVSYQKKLLGEAYEAMEDTVCISVGLVDAPNRYAESDLNSELSIESTTCITSPSISATMLKEKYLKNQLSMRAISKELACSRTHIRDLLVRYNIPLRKSYAHPRSIYGKKKIGGKLIDHKIEIKTAATIKSMYEDEDLRPTAIARLLNIMKVPTRKQGKGWHHDMVITILKREGIYKQTRTGGQTRGTLKTKSRTKSKNKEKISTTTGSPHSLDGHGDLTKGEQNEYRHR